MNNIKNKLEEFNRRWSIANLSNYAEEFQKFKNRILNVLVGIDSRVSDGCISTFCNIIGIQEKWRSTMNGPHSTNIIDQFIIENDEKRFYYLLQVIFLLPITASMKGAIFQDVSQAIELSNINLSAATSGEEIILYPKGEKKFDEELVDEVVKFLNQESLRHFTDALKYYEGGGIKNAIKSAEELRRALEEFLRFKLRNSDGLDKNIINLQRNLKKGGEDPILRNIIFTTFSYLDKYFNENSKHKDGEIDEPENEFLIYQSGILMRYINKVVISE